MTVRAAVFAALNQEREYQDTKWAEADEVNTPGDFILYLSRLVDRARALYVSPVGDLEPTMTEIRKVAATAVAAMEKFGSGTPRVADVQVAS